MYFQRTDLENVLYHSAFYSFFLDTAFRAPERASDGGDSLKATNGAVVEDSPPRPPRNASSYLGMLRILGSIGCDVAREVVNLMEEEGKTIQERRSSKAVVSSIALASSSLHAKLTRESCSEVDEPDCLSSASWMRQFQLASVAHLRLHDELSFTPSSDIIQCEENRDEERESLLLQLLQDVHRHQKEKQCSNWRFSIIQYLAEELEDAMCRQRQNRLRQTAARSTGKTNVGEEEVADVIGKAFFSGSSVLFSWKKRPPGEGSVPPVSRPAENFAHRKRFREEDGKNNASTADIAALSLEVAWLEGRLFAALSLLEGYTVVTPLAKMLVLYLYQPVPSSMVTSSANSSNFFSRESREQWSEDEAGYRYARASGVVAGILEVAFEIARTALSRASRMLRLFLKDEEKEKWGSTASSSSHAEALASKDSRAVERENKQDAPLEKGILSSCGSASSSSLSSAYPLPEETTTLLVNTGMLLARLVEYATTYESDERETKVKEENLKDTSSPPISQVTVPTLGEIVMNHVQDLLTSLLTGCGTEHVKEGTSSGASSHGSAGVPAKSESHRSFSKQTFPVLEEIRQQCRSAVSVSRGLILAEADALLAFIFPSLLQSVGYEWCWSEGLRYFRMVENSQLAVNPASTPGSSLISLYQQHLDRWQGWTPAALEYCAPTSSSSFPSTIMTQETEGKGPLSPVCWAMNMGQWHSKTVVDAILIACAKRTYPSRLYQLLPGSYHTILDALGVLPAVSATEVVAVLEDPDEAENGMESASSGSPNSLVVPPLLFTLPTYYDEVSQAVLKYWDRVGTISAIQLDALEHLLHHHTVVLPMMVRIRAMAALSSSSSSTTLHSSAFSTLGKNRQAAIVEKEKRSGDDVREEREEVLTADTVEALLARYQAEVLIAAVVVYTQLAVPSQYQALLRVIAPLLERYLLTYSRFLGNVGGPPFPLFSTASASGVMTVPSFATSSSLVASLPYRFSCVVQRVCGEAGYQLYPLEWLPQVGEMYLQHLRGNTQTEQQDISTSFPYYSMFAAVAHQFHLSFRTPIGNSGGSSSRCVRSILALATGGHSNSVLMPPFPRPTKEAALYSFPAASQPHSMDESAAHQFGSKWKEMEEDKTVEYRRGRQRVERFTQFMQWIYLDMRTDIVASVELAVEKHGHNSGASGREEAFFHTFVEAKDFWLVACQGFLPYTDEEESREPKESRKDELGRAAALYYTQKNTSSFSLAEAIPGSTWAYHRLETALRWCQHVIASPSEEMVLNTMVQQHQNERKGEGMKDRDSGVSSRNENGRDTVVNAFSSSQLWKRRKRLFLYDSATFDASLEARVFLRSVLLRLLEKWRWIRQVREEEMRKEEQECTFPTPSQTVVLNAGRSPALRELDTASFLLQLQLRQWDEMRERVVDDDNVLSVIPFSGEEEAEQETIQYGKWGIREWWWNSPLFFDELREM